MIKTKKENKLKGIAIGIVLLVIILGTINLIRMVETKSKSAANWTQYEMFPTAQASVVVPDKKEKLEPTMKEWVLNEVSKAGLDVYQVDRIIQCESGWDNWKYGINTNGSTDFGLWQINSIHKKTASVECRWDYKCATRWSIQKRLDVGHWNDWVCNK